MPSILQAWCRDYPYDARMKNLAKARRSPRYHPRRPWRSEQESEMIRRFTFQWFTCRDSNKPSGRSWARQLGVSHTWLQKLVREFQRNPDEMWRLQLAEGDPKLTDLGDAQECSREMRQRGELRPLRYRLPANVARSRHKTHEQTETQFLPVLPTQELACVIKNEGFSKSLLGRQGRISLGVLGGFNHPGVAYRGYLTVCKEAALWGWYWSLNLHSDRMVQQQRFPI